MPTLDEELLAQQYGFAWSVLNSNAELKALFNKAVEIGYEPDKFIAELRSTDWYQNNSETWRSAQILKSADPATYNSQVQQVRTRMNMMASEMGANVWQVLDKMAESAFQLGWDDNQIRQALSQYINITGDAVYGQANQWMEELRARALDQGIRLGDETMQNWVRRIAGGYETLDGYLSEVNEMAVSAYPHLAERLRAGQTVADIASPYRQTMAALFERVPDEVSLWDPTIRSAMSQIGQDGKPNLQSLHDFEVGLRKDTRWLKTANARDAAMGTTRKILSDWGLVK